MINGRVQVFEACGLVCGHTGGSWVGASSEFLKGFNLRFGVLEKSKSSGNYLL